MKRELGVSTMYKYSDILCNKVVTPILINPIDLKLYLMSKRQHIRLSHISK